MILPADVVYFVPLGHQPWRECRQQVGVDEELHGSMAVTTG
jgi:hypothetical protein